MSHQAQFFDRIATFEPASQPCAFRWLAMRRDWFATSAQVKSLTTPAPMGWVSAMRPGIVFSQR